jgi:hypothetical protein
VQLNALVVGQCVFRRRWSAHKAGANEQAHPAGNGKEWNSSRNVAHEGEGFRDTIPHWPGQSSLYEAGWAQGDVRTDAEPCRSKGTD